MNAFKSESIFRAEVKKILDYVEKSLSEVDPDLVECQGQFGAMTLQIREKQKWVLSAQPSVQQIWLAMASLGKAYHFNFNPQSGGWVDDKDQSIELLQHLDSELRKSVGVGILTK